MVFSEIEAELSSESGLPAFREGLQSGAKDTSHFGR